MPIAAAYWDATGVLIPMKITMPPTRGIVEALATLSLLGTLLIVILELSANQKVIRSAAASDVALSLSSW